MNHSTMENIIIKTEPLDTYDTSDDQREPESLQMVCDSEHNVDRAGLSDGNGFSATQQRLLENEESKRENSTATIDFKSIRGIPVNLPFRVRYSSSAIDGVVESKVYIITEFTGEVSLPPIIVNVMGVHEIPSSGASSTNTHDQSTNCDLEEGSNEFLYNGTVNADYNDESDTETADCDRNPVDIRKKPKDKHKMIENILNDVIGSVVKQNRVRDQIKGGGKRRMYKKRKSSINQINFKKKQKIIKLEDHTEKSVIHSSRILSKGYRINYTELDEVNSASEIEDVAPEGNDVDDTLGNREDCLSKSMLKAEKNEDPDFVYNGHEGVGSQTSIQNESDFTKIKRNPYNEKCRRERLLKRAAEQQRRKTVILSDHTDKFYVEDQMSMEMRHRGKADSEKTFKLMVCKECNIFRTEDKRLMETHLEYHVNGDLSCEMCDFKASSKMEMAKHKNEHPSAKKKKSLTCLLCAERFPVQQHYHDHMTTVHNLLPYLCTVCSTKQNPITFKDLQDYKEHYIANHKDLMKQCTYCGLYHLHRRALKDHVCTAKSKQEVPCDICGKELRPKSLQKHKRTVHFNVRTFPCTECKYAASHPLLLQQHIQAKHEGVHNYKCDVCDFTCVRPYQLTSHMRTHTGDKPYKCDQCPYAAAWNVQLKDHKKLHGSTLGIECEQCGILLRSGAPYTKHLKKEHGGDA